MCRGKEERNGGSSREGEVWGYYRGGGGGWDERTLRGESLVGVCDSYNLYTKETDDFSVTYEESVWWNNLEESVTPKMYLRVC